MARRKIEEGNVRSRICEYARFFFFFFFLFSLFLWLMLLATNSTNSLSSSFWFNWFDQIMWIFYYRVQSYSCRINTLSIYLPHHICRLLVFCVVVIVGLREWVGCCFLDRVAASWWWQRLPARCYVGVESKCDGKERHQQNMTHTTI